LTLQSRKNSPFPALFSYVTPANGRGFPAQMTFPLDRKSGTDYYLTIF